MSKPVAITGIKDKGMEYVAVVYISEQGKEFEVISDEVN